MSTVRHPPTSLPARPPGRRRDRRVASFLLVIGLTTGAVTSVVASPARAATVCDPGTDVCVVVPDTVPTPLGPVTVAVSPDNVVTVQLAPIVPCTKVIGIPFAIPPGPPALPGYSHTTITTAAGVVSVDTLIPPGPPCRSLPSLAIISIHPPNPCHVTTSATTVVFTPILPPGPPN